MSAADAQTRFRGRIVDVATETITLPNGTVLEMEVVRHPGGAAVVAVDAHGRVCLLRQYRHVIGDWLWELPAGKIDAGEPPEHTAIRELRDEAGVSADHWSKLGAIVTSPGVFTEVVHLYLATGLTHTAPRPDADEVFECHWLDLDQVVDWALAGEIRDAKSVIGLLRARQALAQEA
jgi:ADP-ribose pyrophosphatase